MIFSFKPRASKYIVLTFRTIRNLILILAAAGFFYFLLKGEYFKVSDIDCSIEGQDCDGQTRNSLIDLVGKNIFLLNCGQFEKKIVKESPQISDVEINKELPGKVYVKIRKREAGAAIFCKEGFWYIIDKEGYVFLKQKEMPQDLEKVYCERDEQNLKIGDKIERDEINLVLELIEETEETFLSLQKIVLGEQNTIKLVLDEEQIAFLTADKKALEQISILQFILRQSKIDGKRPKEIDLRFSKPVIKY